MNSVEQLRQQVELLTAQVDGMRDELQRDIDSKPYGWWTGPVPTPDQMKDTTGRYILVEARIALVQALAALAMADAAGV